MADQLIHRGPDDVGTWVDPKAGVALGFRRLAIVDLSSAGRQPMESASGRYVIVFNGEIYNHRELRRQLLHEGGSPAVFRGHSDTEVLLAGIEAWGLRLTLERAVGMFAFAVWDRHDETLSLARDRLGEKPLYYGRHGPTLLFGSELKALVAHEAFEGQIDREALALYLEHGYIPAPHSIYQQISKLIPGTFVQFSAPRLRHGSGPLPEPVAYWSAKDVAEGVAAALFTGSFEEAADQLEQQIRESIADQMVADVPVGAFLSGGVDSSLIVALMQAQSGRQVKTFTIGFHESSFNEANYAKRVAAHLGTDHTELYVTPAEARAVIPALSTIYDEPFADSSQIPTFFVSQLARKQVTVSLSGDGGDELFGGYTRYALTQAVWKAIGMAPAAVRKPLARLLSVAPAPLLDFLFAWLVPTANRHGSPAPISGKLYRVAKMLKQNSIEGLYRSIMAENWPGGGIVPSLPRLKSIDTEPGRRAKFSNAFQQAMYHDLVSYLPDDILAKVDRAAMAVGLETRVPLLDHRIAEFAWRLPLEFKHREGEGKAILRRILDKHVPRTLIDRPKMGFGVPMDRWLRGSLRDWAADLLGPRQLAANGMFDPARINLMWQQHLAGQRNWQRELWTVLMFQAWSADRSNGLPSRRAA